MFLRHTGKMMGLGLVLSVALTGAAMGDVFLPFPGDLPKAVNEIDPDTSSTHIIKNYESTLVKFSRDIECEGQRVGWIDFEYVAYTGRRAGDPVDSFTIAGAAIRGGAYLDPGFMICEGHQLRWLQTYEENDSGTKVVDGNPFYPIFGINGVVMDLYDVPFDLLTVDIKLQFESALVCIDENGDVSVLGSFFWGYEIADSEVSAIEPTLWGPGLTAGSIAAIEAHDYFANQGHDLVTNDGDCCICEVPEPATASLLALGALAFVRRPGRRAA